MLCLSGVLHCVDPIYVWRKSDQLRTIIKAFILLVLQEHVDPNSQSSYLPLFFLHFFGHLILHLN